MLKNFVAAGAVASALFVGVPAQAAVYDLAKDFSANNGSPWAYGYSSSASPLGVFFPDYTPATSGNSLESWTDKSLPQTAQFTTPSAVHNTSSSEWSGYNSVVILGGQATFHPGQNGEVTSYRFTAPTTSRYSLAALFSGRDYAGPTDTLVSISLLNGSTLFSTTINGYAGDSARAAFGVAPTASYSSTLNLTQGEQLFFNVAFDPAGTRGSGPFYYDTTGVSATLTSAVPEPSTWAMMLVGFLGLAAFGYRDARRKRSSLA